MSEGSNSMFAPQRVLWTEERAPAPRVGLVALEDELGLAELEALGQQLLRLQYSGIRHVVVDFAEVPHLDYRGVRPLLSRVERLREAGGDVKLSGLSPYLAAILRAAGAHGKFDSYATPEEAQAAFALDAETPRRWR